MRRTTFDVVILLAVTTAIAVVVGLGIPLSQPDSPSRIAALHDVIAGRSIAHSPYSVGYLGFAGLLMRWLGTPGLIVAQAALYVATVLFSYDTLRDLGVRGGARLAGALAVAVYPNVIFNITRIYDTGISCFLMSVLAWLVVRLNRHGLTTANAAIGGVLFGLMLLVRPNALILLPIALWAAFRGRRLWRADLPLLGAAFALAVGILAAATVPLKGRFVVFDRYYAAYTFCNGTHDHALEGMLRDYNGEMTMPRTMQELGLTSQGLERTDGALADQYLRVAWQFIREHPVRYLGLEAFKIVNLFRPDYRNADHSFVPAIVGRLAHTMIAALFFVWATIRWRSRRLTRFDDRLMLIPTLALYFLPFVVTNTDPRYRVPVDALLIVDSVLCVSLLRSQRESRRSVGSNALQAPVH